MKKTVVRFIENNIRINSQYKNIFLLLITISIMIMLYSIVQQYYELTN